MGVACQGAKGAQRRDLPAAVALEGDDTVWTFVKLVVSLLLLLMAARLVLAFGIGVVVTGGLFLVFGGATCRCCCRR